MKLNKDNYEMVMFDLLEGNLSEADELRVMEHIESDEFLFREWKLFKSTILIADKDVAYSRKEGLLKKESVAVPMFTRWAAIAASICILAAAVVFWPRTVTTPLATTDAPKIETVAPDSELVDLVPQPDKSVLKTEGLLKDAYKQFVTPVHKHKATVATLKHKPKPVSKHYEVMDNILPSPKVETVHSDVVKIKPDVLDRTPVAKQSPKREEELIADISIPQRPVSLSKKEKAIEFVTKNPPSRIKQTALGMIALLSNPKLHIKPNFKSNRPSLDIELETTGYQAVASIQPFKNRN